MFSANAILTHDGPTAGVMTCGSPKLALGGPVVFSAGESEASAMARPPVLDRDRFTVRFMSKVCVGFGGTCWIWLGSRNAETQYGGAWDGIFERRRTMAHRLSYMLFRGPIPPALEIDHLCRNRLCVNPDHLEAVTPRVNVLRGFGPIQAQARATACRMGHAFALQKSGDRTRRFCPTCKADRQRASRAANRPKEQT